MTDKKELNNEELEKISGGRGLSLEELKEIEAEYPISLTKYESANHIGREVLLTNQLFDRYEYEYVIGTLLKSYEKSNDCVGTTRTAAVQVTKCEGVEDRLGYQEFSLNHWRIFTK